MMKQKPILYYLRSYAMISLGALIYAVAFVVFFAPNDMAFGGVTGVAQMINRLVPSISVGSLLFVINVPLFLAAWRFLGKQMFIGSLYAVGLISVLMNVLESRFTVSPLQEPVLGCVFGGVLIGLAYALICKEGASVGGTDIGSRLFRLKYPQISVGKVIMWMDIIVVAGVASVFQKVNSALLGMLALYIIGIIMDKVLMGMNPSKVAYVISDQASEVAKMIMRDLHRGVTILHGEGAWSGSEKNVLLCAFKNNQIVTLKRSIEEIDPKAFLILCDAYEVLGDGFVKNESPKSKAKKAPAESNEQ